MIVRFKPEFMEVTYKDDDDDDVGDARVEQVIKAVLVVDGTEMCTVGFLPRSVAARTLEVQRLHNKFAQILELYDNAPPSRTRYLKSQWNRGMASFILLDSIQVME